MVIYVYQRHYLLDLRTCKIAPVSGWEDDCLEPQFARHQYACHGAQRFRTVRIQGPPAQVCKNRLFLSFHRRSVSPQDL